MATAKSKALSNIKKTSSGYFYDTGSYKSNPMKTRKEAVNFSKKYPKGKI